MGAGAARGAFEKRYVSSALERNPYLIIGANSANVSSLHASTSPASRRDRGRCLQIRTTVSALQLMSPTLYCKFGCRRNIRKIYKVSNTVSVSRYYVIQVSPSLTTSIGASNLHKYYITVVHTYKDILIFENQPYVSKSPLQRRLCVNTARPSGSTSECRPLGISRSRRRVSYEENLYLLKQ